MVYRREIDGLRALAVIPVILFHAGFNWFSGGFVGVDVFFVISGYLITFIIIEQKARRSFSILEFYERRARRILPALYCVMLACIPFAWAYMMPDDLENFGQSLVATSLFINNILLWFTSNYFQLEAEFKPLLHTWSLGLEEQYLIVYPALILLLWFAGRRGLFIILAAGGVISLGLAEWGWRNAPEANYYLIFSRAWELLAGAVTAIYLKNRPRKIRGNQLLSLLGLILILFSVFTFDANTPWPSSYSLIPVLGTVLLIVFATPTTMSGKIFSLPILVGLGLMSYSLYLWHQPILAFMRITRLQEPTLIELAICLVTTVALSALSYHYVEKPFRKPEKVKRKLFLASCLSVSAVLAGTGLYLHLTSGLLSDWPELADEYGRNEAGVGRNAAYNKMPLRFQGEGFPDNGRMNVLVLGNSFARDFINAGLENEYFTNKNLIYVPGGGICLLAEEEYLDATTDRLLRSADAIVLSCSVDRETATCVAKAAERLIKLSSVKALVIGTKNFGWNNNAVMLIDVPERYQLRVTPLAEVRRANDTMRNALAPYPQFEFVDVMAFISDNEGKVPVFTPSRKFISQDRKHLTQAGAKFVGKKLLAHPGIRALARSSR